jgi:hypothetical protein
MSTGTLRMLQLNIMKSRAGMEALINDTQTQNLDILLIQEPSVTAYQTHVNHRLWQLYQPTYTEEGTRKRSLLYVHKRISTSAHRQIHGLHEDGLRSLSGDRPAHLLLTGTHLALTLCPHASHPPPLHLSALRRGSS